MEGANGFGPTLKALRRERRLSLQEVSSATGISVSFLSIVENGKSDITLGRLIKLAGFFDVHVSDLLPPGVGRDPIVIRSSERRHIASPSEGMDISLLAPDSERRMLPLFAEFEPGGHPAEMSQHEGEEFIYVLSGRVLFEIEGHEPVALEPGDAAFYRADRPHLLTALDDAPASLIAVASPPHL
jgi:transcriptional regulator with XRE-family HTH domain